MSEQRVLPRWFYDRVNRQASKYNGIGLVDFYRGLTPNCVYGLLFGRVLRPFAYVAISDSLLAHFNLPTPIECDRITMAAGCSYWGRVPFAAWCEAGGIVRGK